ncbi:MULTISPECIES: hypothetical protein [unclassified Streptomyces]|uniref:hypothetical protein n=1 Tax=unclassified Streptomyces TaxID=2593676 RepID=UPI000C27B875|nr:hypothetical protein [Streptomyces sp. CB01373]PJM91842.1 hypothetical protein CG719_32095 [Streptomyces sp. CB01373]
MRWCFRRSGRETLHRALANLDDLDTCQRERRAREKAAKRAEQEAVREASRCPVCRLAQGEYQKRSGASSGTPPASPVTATGEGTGRSPGR